MKRLALAAALLGAAWMIAAHRSRGGMVRVTLTDEVVVPEVRRFGVNLGTWTTWGAEQLSANVLKNPGFEGVVDRAIVVVAFSGSGEFSDDTAWLARPDGFWAGATYEVLAGRAAGARGRIRDSRSKGAGGLPVFFTEAVAAPVDHGDVVALTRVDDTGLPTQWWIDSSEPGLARVENTPRPGSPGIRALNLSRPGAKVSSYLDAIGERAGKLLPVEGPWRVAFWGRSSREGAVVAVTFLRQGSPAFLSERVELAPEWRLYERMFQAQDSGPAGILELSFANASDSAEILLDDVVLVRASREAGAFRSEVSAALGQFRPGYLRDWQGQLGDTLDNRICPPFARRASRYRPGGPEATDFAYGLEETLALCRRVGADPWLVVPTTFGRDECAGFGRYLASNAADFGEVVVEFGNENWNPLFRPAGIPEFAAHAAAAGSCLETIRKEADSAVLRTVVNAQAVNQDGVARMAALAPQADMVAVAPYFLPSLASGLSLEERLAALFAPLPAAIAAGAQRLAVYEVNLHTVDGDATAAERHPVTESAAAGAALAGTMLECLRAGATRQCAYALAGFDARLAKTDGYVGLWGVTRDLAAGDHWRATGRALVLLNRVLDGSLHRSTGERDGVEVFGFRGHDAWSAAIVNRAAESRHLEILFAAGGSVPGSSILLTGAGAQESALRHKEAAIELDVPAQSLIVLPPRGVS